MISILYDILNNTGDTKKVALIQKDYKRRTNQYKKNNTFLQKVLYIHVGI